MTPDMKVLYKDFFPEDLEPLIKQKNITKTVIVQAADTVAETEFTLSLASKYEFIAGVVGWVPGFDIAALQSASRGWGLLLHLSLSGAHIAPHLPTPPQ